MSFSGFTIFERSELLICRVHQFVLECVKNCALQRVLDLPGDKKT